MGLGHSPSIVTSGLVLALDAGNTKSYPGSGTTWTDLSGNGNTGTLTNGPTYSSSNGGVIVFDGTNDYVENLSPNLGISGDANITLACWFYYTGASSSVFSALFGYGNGGSNGDTIALGLNGAGTYQVSFQFNAASTYSVDNSYSPNTWVNLVGTKTPGAANTTTKLYVNGQQVSISASTTITPNVVSRVIRLGRWINDGSPYYYTGRIAQAQIYNTALTAAQVLQNFNALRGRFGL